jgi:hypothetical protein
MPVCRLQIYAGPPIRAALADVPNDERSHALNVSVARYRAILRRSLPDLARPEWYAICDACNGLWLASYTSEDADLAIATFWAEIADSGRLSDLGGKWGVDAQAVAKKIHDLPFAAKAAVAEVVERFWRHADDPSDVALSRALDSIQ